ncbi:hypothetical protein MAR_032103 [Mya arenaria]|uniref:C1q domain-containing protein n=1 Tax=Mya arenaria TaxID=6604 RepID=A0ABY7F9P4_MYAAR|nr:hypothetical protein MAR_032103 [Mya arenaria]
MWTATLVGYRQELHYLRAENEALTVAANPEGEVVAFKAIHARDRTVDKGQILVFKDYVMNHGNAYDNLTGICVAPTKGLYLFSGQICTEVGQTLFFGLMVNFNAYMRDLPHDTSSRECSTFTEPIVLSEGDRVWVQAFRDNENIYEDEHRWSSFAGILIRNL